MANKKTKKIVFVASPTGAYDLAYSAGDVAVFEEKQAMELVESGYANYFDSKKDTETDSAQDADAEQPAPEEANE